MDLLKQKFLEYKTLKDNDYFLKLENEQVIKINFEVNSFPHLVGLHKLTQIPLLNQLANKNIPPKAVIRAIKQGNLTYGTIYSQDGFSEIEERFKSFSISKINKLLNKNIVIDFDLTKINSSMTKAEMILFEKDNNKYYHLVLGYDQKGYYYPLSYFVRKDEDYIKNQTYLKVKSLKVVKYKTNEVIKHIYYLDNIREIIKDTNAEIKLKLDKVKELIKDEVNYDNINFILNKLDKEYNLFIKEEKNFKIIEHKFAQGKLLLDHIEEKELELKNISITQSITSNKKAKLKNSIEKYFKKLNDLGFIDRNDYIQKKSEFNKEKSTRLIEIEKLKNKNRKAYRILVEGKSVLDSLEHKAIIEVYKDEFRDAVNWDRNITKHIQNLNEKEGNTLTFNGISNYSGEHANIVKVILKNIKKDELIR